MIKSKAILIILSILFSRSVVAQDKVESQKQIPIMAWYSIPASETTVERYQEMKDAGITHSLSFFANVTDLQKALDVAAKVGVKLIVNCHELKTDPEKTVRLVMNHPATAGYHLIDEPGIGLYKELGDWGRRIQAVDSKHFCYVNLFPNFADSTQLGTKDYRKYVSECARQIPLQFLSFDYYPVLKDRLSKTWYENLEQFSSEAKKANKPFWAFALTTNYDDGHLTPQTMAAMRLQVFSDLAYGAQGIQYFTYWSATSVNSPSSEDQRGAPITADGKRSVVYDRVKQMSEEIRNLSGVFLGAKMIWVRHTAKGMIPAGTIRLTSLPDPVKVLDSNGAPILVSLLENGDYNYLVVVNKDFQNSINLTFYGDDSVKKVLKDGTLVPSNTYEPSMELDPGDAAIYQFPKANTKLK
ncbi:MAG: hypothetical protein WCI31_04230 [Prolixibacteraceae bacterium]